MLVDLSDAHALVTTARVRDPGSSQAGGDGGADARPPARDCRDGSAAPAPPGWQPGSSPAPQHPCRGEGSPHESGRLEPHNPGELSGAADTAQSEGEAAAPQLPEGTVSGKADMLLLVCF